MRIRGHNFLTHIFLTGSCYTKRILQHVGILISACYLYQTAHSDGSGEVSVGGVTDGTDRYEYFVVLSEIFAYASIEIFR